jgi:uncharacterized membrane protein
LLGGGLAMLYISVYGAYHFYHLIEALPAFVLMGLITVLAGGIAVYFDSMLVAVLGILGGYGTPVMLSTGEINFLGLYGYMLMLGIGVLGMCYWKNWPLVNLLSFVCTYALFFVSLTDYRVEYFDQVMPFLVAFFVLFSTMTFLYKLVRRAPSNLLDLVALLVNVAIFFAVSRQLVFEAYGRQWVAAVTLGLAAFYTVHVYYLLARKIVDRELLVSFIGLATCFLAITMPILLSPEWVTASWAVEALVLLWIAQKLGSVFLRHACYVLFGIVIARFAAIDLAEQFLQNPATGDLATGDYLRQLLARVVAFGVPIASLGAASWLLARTPADRETVVDRANDIPDFVGGWAGRVCVALAMGLMLVYLNLELYRTIGFFYAPAMWPVLTLLWLAFCGWLLSEALRAESETGFVVLILALVLVVAKLLIVDLSSWGISAGFYYAEPYSVRDAIMRLVDFGAVAGFFGAAYALVAARRRNAEAKTVFASSALAVLFVYTTLELNTYLHSYLDGMRYGGISILWSVFALSFLLVGILRNLRPLRYAGLTLFAVVAYKVFFVDLAQLDSFYRIIAFIVLGLLVLAASFVYLKFRESFAVGPAGGAGEDESAAAIGAETGNE